MSDDISGTSRQNVELWLLSIPIPNGPLPADLLESSNTSDRVTDFGVNRPSQFNRMRDELQGGLSIIRDEADPFKRLAWLIEEHETIYHQLGKSTRIPEILDLSDKDKIDLLQDSEHLLRNYHELNCRYDFPRLVIKELKPIFRQAFIDVLRETMEDENFGIDFNDDQILDVIEEWLRFHEERLAIRRPDNGLVTGLAELRHAREKLDSDSCSELDKNDIIGLVTGAFVMSENLLRQLLLFYGRAFYGPTYVEDILLQYDNDVNNKAQCAGCFSFPELRTELGELLKLPEGKDREEAEQHFLEFLLKSSGKKIKCLPEEAKKFHKLIDKNKGMSFLSYAKVLHSLDRWIAISCELKGSKKDDMRGQKFNWIFARKRLFPLDLKAIEAVNTAIDKMQDPLHSIILQWVEPGKEEKDVFIYEKDTSPFIIKLRELNMMRPLYVHSGNPIFLHSSNHKNLCEASKIILDEFIKIWKYAKEAIFPRVINIRRILLIHPDIVRLDYVAEDSESSLECIRVRIASEYLFYFMRLLGHDAYLWAQAHENDLISDLALYPVNERLQEENIQ